MHRTQANQDVTIKRYIELLKANARPEVTHIHLIKSDFARVKRDPPYFDATKQADGRIITVLNSRLVEVVPVS